MNNDTFELPHGISELFSAFLGIVEISIAAVPVVGSFEKKSFYYCQM
jgi:hypothetical protein